MIARIEKIEKNGRMNDHLGDFTPSFLSWPLIAINHWPINEEKIKICRVAERNERSVSRFSSRGNNAQDGFKMKDQEQF